MATCEKMFIYNLPLRSSDTPPLWNKPEMALGMKELLEEFKIRGTWLLRYDTMHDPYYLELCSQLNDEQELGIWLEITPSHAAAASVPYSGNNDNWFWAKHALTMGYHPEERIRLIDVVMEKFHSLFHKFPEVVSMWMVDSFSAQYLMKNYQIKIIGLCRNQYGIDGYTMWGGWPNLPYWADREYIWQPATESAMRGPLVYPIISEDLVADYGNEKGIWSTEVATLQLQKLPIETIELYHQKLVENCLAGSPVGLASFVAENSWDWQLLKEGYRKQLAHLAELMQTGQAQSVTASQFRCLYEACFPVLSPKQVLEQRSGWGGPFPESVCAQVCTKHYRARFRTDDDQSLLLTDLRVYDKRLKDPYWSERATERFASWIIPFFLDSSRFGMDGSREEPRVDVSANNPMGFRVTPCLGLQKGRLSILEDELLWETPVLTVKWQFEEEDIVLIAESPAKPLLELIYNPQVLPLEATTAGRQLALSEGQSWCCKEVILVNGHSEAQGAAVRIVSEQELRCCWHPNQKCFQFQSENSQLRVRLQPYLEI